MNELSVSTDAMRRNWHIGDDFQVDPTDNARWRVLSRPHAWRPPTDVYEIEEAIIVRIEVAGMRESDFSISLVGKSLSIRGVRQDTAERRAYHQMEIPFGEFHTEIELNVPILPDKVDATYSDGFLRITLPLAQPKRIKVEGQ